MAERSIIDQLDDAVTALLEQHELVASVELTELVAVARELRGLPPNSFAPRSKNN